MVTSVRVENNTIYAVFEGRLDSVTSSSLETQINKNFDNTIKTISIDMEKVDFISSKGLRILVSFYKALPDGDLRLINPNSMVTEVIKLAGLLNTFKVENK